MNASVEGNGKGNFEDSNSFHHIGAHSGEDNAGGGGGIANILVVDPQISQPASIIRDGSVPRDGLAPHGGQIAIGKGEVESSDGPSQVGVADHSSHGLEVVGEGGSGEVGCVVGGVVEVGQHRAGSV